MKKFKKIIAMCLTAAMALSMMSVGAFAAEKADSGNLKAKGTNQILATATEGDIYAEMERLGLSLPDGMIPVEVGVLPNTGLTYVVGSPAVARLSMASIDEDTVMPLSDSWSDNVTIYPYVEGQYGTNIRTFTTYPGTRARLSWLGFTTASSMNIGIKDNVSGADDYIMAFGPNDHVEVGNCDPSHTYTWRGSLNGTTSADNIRFSNVAPY